MTHLPHLRLPGRFGWLWSCHAVIAFGGSLAQFAFTIWTYQQTGQATSLALIGFFNTLSYVLFSPLAGAVVDRYDRRKVLAAATLATGVLVAGLVALFALGRLELWHVYLEGILANALGAFYDPALLASMGRIVPEEEMARANGLIGMARDGANMVGPLLAGLLIPILGVGGLLAIDLVTGLIGAAIIRLAPPQGFETPEAGPGRIHWLGESAGAGFRYIFATPGLAGILAIYAGINLFAALTYYAVLPAMILARSGQDQMALGSVQSMLGLGGLIGGGILSVWGGPQKRIYGYLGATMISFMLGDFLFAVGRSTPAWVIAASCSASFIPFIVSCYNAIWQVKVPKAVQGRVFAARAIIQIGSMPFGYLAGGLLADRVFEPAFNAGLAPLSTLVGSGPGAGMGVMFLLTAVLGCMTGGLGLLLPAVRRVEEN